MDDFGTGYSSLSYLSRFPVDILKMDRSFLASGARRIAAWPRRSSRSASASSLDVVAEGIEQPEQIASLRDLGCELGQGFLFAEPMPHEALVEYLATDGRGRARRSRVGCSIASRRSTAPAASPASACSRPLRHRDFRLLWAGMTVSLVGDGIFLVAIAWKAYALWNAPAALSIVGIAMTVPTIACLLPAGVLSDRFDRRRVLLSADLGRALASRARGARARPTRLTFWELVRARRPLRRRHGVLHAGVRGDRARHRAGGRPRRRRTRSTSSSARSRCASPARRSAAGSSRASAPATAFAVDAASFAVSAVAVVAHAPSARHPRSAHVESSRRAP